MVYLGLQDDDEHDYDASTSPTTTTATPPTSSTTATAASAADRSDAEATRPTTVGGRAIPTAATSRDPSRARADCGTDTAPSHRAPAVTRPTVGPAPVRRSASEPSGDRRRAASPERACARVGVRRPRPGCTSSSRSGFNDAQEVGDRLKANQPVILNLQGARASCSVA